MTLNVLWRSNLAADLVTDHRNLFCKDINLTVETDKDKAQQHSDYAVLVDGNPDAALLDAPSLQHVVVPYVGVNDALRENVRARPHLKLYNSHFNDAFVAQHAVALLLACSNRLVAADHALRQGDWRPRHDDALSVFLPGKTCLLLGYGAIGRAVETRVRGLGMQVSALRREPNKEGGVKQYGPDELHEALGAADAVVVSLPSTPQTKNFLDEAALKALKPGGILVNVGRGDVIDQHALYDALKTQYLFAAGIDVWWTYPKDEADRAHTSPADAPLFELPNIVMSPHRANQVQGWERESLKDVARTLNALATGAERNRVDPDRGY